MRVVLVFAFSLLLTVPSAFASNTNAGEVELSREGKASINMALQYLASRQRADGSFNGNMGKDAGIVAAGALAWMAAGNLPGEGPYGKQVAKSIDYILDCAQPSGLLYRGKQDQHVMYQHGLAAIALAEAWGQTRDKRIHDKLKKAIDLIIRTQNDKGGWRYQPRVADDDLSVTVMELLALRAAKDAGMAVPRENIDRAIAYVESCRDQRDSQGLSGFAYQPHGGKKWSTTAAGVMSLMLCGNYKAKDIKDPLEYLVKTREKKEDKEWFIYGHYYAAMAFYQAGAQGDKFRQYWLKWYPDISQQIIKSQKTSGGERGDYGIDERSAGYGVWRTGMCVLILGIPYRYLPIYQR